MANEKKKVGTSDPKTDARFKQEKTYWSDLLDVKDSVVGQLGINLATCEELSKQNPEYFVKDADAGLMLLGITKSYLDVSKDLKELNDKLDNKIFKDKAKTTLLDIRNPEEKKKLVVRPKDEIPYMSLFVGYTEAAETIGRLGVDLMINLSTKLNCADVTEAGTSVLSDFNTQANAIEEKVMDTVTTVEVPQPEVK